MTETIETSDGRIEITHSQPGIRTVEVFPSDPNQFIAVHSCKTSYSTALIERIVALKGLAWVCDEINRDEDPNYVAKYLLNDLNAYFAPDDFTGKTVLDFGCGSGASTAILARTFPGANFTGVELLPELLEVAKDRARHYGFKNVRFIASPSESALPPDLGEFDFVIMSAVVEHLLPDERLVVLPLLWRQLKTGGYLFLDQTPYRYFPFELHTTMLPLINYLPDRIAFDFAKRFSRRIDATESWESLLRQGIRGATIREIHDILENVSPVKIVECRSDDVKSRVDLWFKNTNTSRAVTTKRLAKNILNLLERTTGVCMVPDLAVALQKI